MNEGICSVCAGTGIPVSGSPCICGGTGLTVDELHGLRMAILTKDTEIERLRGLIREYGTHHRSCEISKAGFVWGLDIPCTCGFKEALDV